MVSDVSRSPRDMQHLHGAFGSDDFGRRAEEARVAAAVAAGGRIVDDSHAPEWWTLASPENHGVDIAAWPDLENYDGD